MVERRFVGMRVRLGGTVRMSAGKGWGICSGAGRATAVVMRAGQAMAMGRSAVVPGSDDLRDGLVVGTLVP